MRLVRIFCYINVIQQHPEALNRFCITFDVEEFDLPSEYGIILPPEEQTEVTRKGLQAVHELISSLPVTATFFVTGTYAKYDRQGISDLSQKHEIASHGMFHSSFKGLNDLIDSKKLLEEISGKEVVGFRQPYMRPNCNRDLLAAGYRYNSSLNPTWIPGRYNNLGKPVKPHYCDGMMNIPVSVSPGARIPLFWLSFKNLPAPFFRMLTEQTLKSTGFLNIYFHPWEFAALSGFKVPAYMKNPSGTELIDRLDQFLRWLMKRGAFFTLGEAFKENIEQ